MECNPQALIYYSRSTKIKNGGAAFKKKTKNHYPCQGQPLHGLRTVSATGPSSSVPQSQSETPGKPTFCTIFSMILFYFNLILSLNITK